MPEQIVLELWHLLPTMIYFVVGVVLFGGTILLMEKLTPFSIRKEIEDEHNVAMAIIMGATLVGLSIILAAAIL